MLIRLQNELTSLKAANQEQQTKIHQLEEALHKSKNDAVGKLVAKPTSCRDISNIGTQTSGYYLVQGLSGKALDAVFCDFSLPIAGINNQYILIFYNQELILTHFVVMYNRMGIPHRTSGRQDHSGLFLRSKKYSVISIPRVHHPLEHSTSQCGERDGLDNGRL